MYCQSCGKEIEERAEKCPYCNSVIFNVFVPNSSPEKEEPAKTEVFVKAVKPEKKMKRPSTKPIIITSIVMYAVLFANYLACSVYDFFTGHPYGYKTVLDVVFSVLFLMMLIFASLGKMDKKLTLIAFAVFCIFELAYNGMNIVNHVYFLAEAGSIRHHWYILASLILRLCLVASMTVVLVFSFIFNLEKKFSPLPICISSGIFIIFEIFALIFNFLIMALGIVPIDLFIILSSFAVFTYFGITIAQAFLFHSHDKYRLWLANNSIK